MAGAELSDMEFLTLMCTSPTEMCVRNSNCIFLGVGTGDALVDSLMFGQFSSERLRELQFQILTA